MKCAMVECSISPSWKHVYFFRCKKPVCLSADSPGARELRFEFMATVWKKMLPGSASGLYPLATIACLKGPFANLKKCFTKSVSLDCTFKM